LLAKIWQIEVPKAILFARLIEIVSTFVVERVIE